MFGYRRNFTSITDVRFPTYYCCYLHTKIVNKKWQKQKLLIWAPNRWRCFNFFFILRTGLRSDLHFLPLENFVNVLHVEAKAGGLTEVIPANLALEGLQLLMNTTHVFLEILELRKSATTEVADKLTCFLMHKPVGSCIYKMFIKLAKLSNLCNK